jgi:predicted MFS family arabinose efflux permease
MGAPSPDLTKANAGAPSLRAARLAVSALFWVSGVLFANWVARIPAVQTERGLSHGELGLALLALGLGALVSMPLAGWAAVRVGSDRVCRWAAFGYCALLPGLALAPGNALFVAGLFCFGAVHGALDVAMNLQAVEVERGYDRPIMSSFHALFSFGGLVGSLMGGAVAAAGLGPRLHFSIVAALLIAVSVLFIFPHLAREERPVESTDREEPEVSLQLPARRLAILGIIAFCVMMGEGAMADWSAIFLRTVTGAGEGIAAAGYAAFSVAMAIGRFTGDRLTLRFGPVNLVRGGGLLAATGLALALFFGQPIVALAGFAIVGAGFATVVPVVFSAARQSIAGVSTIGYLGFLLGPPLIGLAAEWLGLREALILVMATSLLLAALAGGVGRRSGYRHEERPLEGNPLQELT